MLYALKDREKSAAHPGDTAICPQCGSLVIPKCGMLKVWHWAHLRKTECDRWSEGETEWHLSWKLRLPKDRVEVVIRREQEYIDPIEGRYIKMVSHRADAITENGVVIEFQHSSISPQVIAEREEFYGKMEWVFDCQDAYTAERLRIFDKGAYVTFVWKQAKKHIFESSKPMYLDFSEVDHRLLKVVKVYTDGRYGGWGKLINKNSIVI